MKSRNGGTGRTRPLTRASITEAGIAQGLRGLSLNGVAAHLGVTPTALYRHIEGRWELERLIGERLLEGLVIPDAPDDDVEAHLRSFAFAMREHLLTHSGLAEYLQVLFPRGDEGIRLLQAEVAALGRRGYAAVAATALVGAVATLTISLAASEDHDRLARGQTAASQEQLGAGFQRERARSRERLEQLPGLRQMQAEMPVLSTPEYVQLLLTAAIRGLLAAAPPGRPIGDTVTDLSGPSGGAS